MVVQLSLLVWSFHTPYLATVLTDALRKRCEGAPPSSSLQSSPDRQGILGVLQACESQTSAFNWNLMLNAVATTLEYKAEKLPMDFPQFVLQGLLDMFPMVQNLPTDRLIHIQVPVGDEIDSGVVMLVVWAHHVVDLTVLVRSCKRTGRSDKSIRFGGSDIEQVFVEEVASDSEASIILLDAQREHLLSIKPKPEEENALIGAVRRVPARGWGNALLADELDGYQFFRTHSQAVLEELQTVVSAFAFIIAKNLIKDDSDRDLDSDTIEMRSAAAYSVQDEALLQASKFLFDNAQINHGDVSSFVAEYSHKPLDDRLPRPPAL